MEFSVVKWVHEKPNSFFDESRSEKGESFSFRPNRPWRMGRDKDCCFIAVGRGAEAGVDKRGSRDNPDELKPMDSRDKSGWLIGTSAPNPGGSTGSTNFRYAERTGLAFREESSGVWFESGALGWTHGGRTPETGVWTKADGEASAALDASVRVPTKESELCLPSGSEGGGQAVSQGFKKNLKV
jgi:hypothetical protein